jgi:hypothetical protein
MLALRSGGFQPPVHVSKMHPLRSRFFDRLDRRVAPQLV